MRADLSGWPGLALGAPILGGHRNEVWSARLNDLPVVVRRSRRSPASLAWELNLLLELDHRGFCVPVPIASIAGSWSVGSFVVQHWIDGRVDVTWHDLSNLAITVLAGPDQTRAHRLSHAWETANAWVVEPKYAQQRFQALMRPARSNGEK